MPSAYYNAIINRTEALFSTIDNSQRQIEAYTNYSNGIHETLEPIVRELLDWEGVIQFAADEEELWQWYLQNQEQYFNAARDIFYDVYN